MKVGEKITILRKRRGWSQEDLANELDVSRQSVYKWETDGAVPDIIKIKKMAKLFDVSFDALLNDDVDINDSKVEVNQSVKQIQKYRRVFNTNLKFDGRQIDYDNGYVLESKKKNHASEILSMGKFSRMRQQLEEYGADATISFPDMAACFFQNTKNKTFGFYYDEAIQFVCPYENLIRVALDDSGNTLSYHNEKRGIVGIGLDGGLAFGVANDPIASIEKPSQYTFTITYFNERNEINEYKLCIDLLYSRYFAIEFSEDPILREDFRRDRTAEEMKDIYNRIQGLPALGEKIRNGEIPVEEIDIDSLTSRSKVGAKISKEYIEELETATKKKNKKILMTKLAIAGASIVAGLVLILVIAL